MTAAILKFSISMQDFGNVMARTTAAFKIWDSAILIMRYPWNPLGTRDYAAVEMED